MTTNLQKGQKIVLAKDSSGGSLHRVMVGLGWEEVPERDMFAPRTAQPIDCDASVILCDADGKPIRDGIDHCCVYFGNLNPFDGSIRHMGCEPDGLGGGDDEQIMVELSRLPAVAMRLVFVANIFEAERRCQHFGMVRNVFIRIVDVEGNREICRFNLPEDYSGMTGIVVGELYRRNGTWKFNAVGQPKKASGLGALIELYR